MGSAVGPRRYPPWSRPDPEKYIKSLFAGNRGKITGSQVFIAARYFPPRRSPTGRALSDPPTRNRGNNREPGFHSCEVPAAPETAVLGSGTAQHRIRLLGIAKITGSRKSIAARYPPGYRPGYGIRLVRSPAAAQRLPGALPVIWGLPVIRVL